MNPLLRLQRLDALHTLSGRLAGESSGGLLGDSLDVLLETMRARAGAGFILDPGLESIAERGLGDRGGPELVVLRRALSTIAQRALSTRRVVILNDLGGDREGIDDAARSSRSARAPRWPSRCCCAGSRMACSCSCSTTPRASTTKRSISRTPSRIMLAVALEREQIRATPVPSNDELAEASRMASLGLLTASVAHELRGPAGAMLLQQEELGRLVEQVAELSDATDPNMSGRDSRAW